jgi:large subunit ribosomal protein L31
MQTAIHPQWFPEATVKCVCGNTFTIGATVPSLEVDVCSVCHPFYTGQMKYLDAAGRVDAFEAKRGKAKEVVLSKTERREAKRQQRITEEMGRPETLEDLRKAFKKAK